MKSTQNKIGSVMVVGGGISGIQAALDSADLGYNVYLVEKSPSLGGLTSRLHRTYPLCFCCKVPPLLAQAERHPHIELLTLSELADIEGEEGDFKAKLIRYPRYINEQKCTACDNCAKVCPVEVRDIQGNLRKAAFRPDPRSIPGVYVIDRVNCIRLRGGECDLCEKSCPEQAIEFGQEEKTISIQVGSIIIATGFEPVDATRLIDIYRYKKLANVLTGLEFEGLLSPFGPSNGVLRRPSDGKPLKKIAWLQCVGSRERRAPNVGYCSSVCCMYALKEAVNAKEKTGNKLETAIFFMDMRAYGRHFETYLEKAKEYGVRLVRARIWGLEPTEEPGDISVTYVTEEGERLSEVFEMVVLSVGLKPSKGTEKLAEKLLIKLNTYGFAETLPFSPVRTSRPGIHVCGALQEPKDIYESVVEASATAAEASAQMGFKRRRIEKEILPIRDISGELPKAAVFICRCGNGAEDILDIQALRDYAAKLPDVERAEILNSKCHPHERQTLIDAIKANKFNRIIFAGCSSRTNEALFAEIVREAGLSPYLCELVNLRELCCFVHHGKREEATDKAKALLRMALAKVMLSQPFAPYEIEVKKSALIIGGGLSGLVAAENLARQGFEAHIIEKENRLGGLVSRLRTTFNGGDIRAYLADLTAKILENPLIHAYTGAEILELSGFAGNFSSKILAKGEEKLLSHGAVIVATDGEELRPDEYLYGKDPRVLTAFEFEEKIAEVPEGIEHVVMIQCVGSREPQRPYCSRICCTQAVKNALKLKDMKPDINIHILYRDMRSYGFREDIYSQARDKGVVFMRYELDSKPEVKVRAGGPLEVSVNDRLLGERLSIEADLIVLGAAIVPPQENRNLSQVLRVHLDEDGFLKQSPKKLRPVETDRYGVFICGLANGPKSVEESIVEAQAASAKAAIILSQSYLEVWPTISVVDLNYCDGCGYCVDPCPYNAIGLFDYMYEGQIKKTVDVNEDLCQGCGICQATCPKKGIGVRNYMPDQLEAMVDAAIAAY